MASGRLLILLLFFAWLSCSTPASLSDDPEKNDATAEVLLLQTELNAEQNVHLPALSDLYVTYSRNQRNPFDVQPVKKDTIPRGNQGFRIQLSATSDRALANSMQKSFMLYSDSTDLGQRMYAYVFFKSPNYRVHVGDFYQKDRALQVAERIRRYFPDAWVIYDTIRPRRTLFYQRLDPQVADSLLRFQ